MRPRRLHVWTARAPMHRSVASVWFNSPASELGRQLVAATDWLLWVAASLTHGHAHHMAALQEDSYRDATIRQPRPADAAGVFPLYGMWCSGNSVDVGRTTSPTDDNAAYYLPTINRFHRSHHQLEVSDGSLTLSPERQSARMSKITNAGLTRSDTGCVHSCTYPYGNSG